MVCYDEWISNAMVGDSNAMVWGFNAIIWYVNVIIICYAIVNVVKAKLELTVCKSIKNGYI